MPRARDSLVPEMKILLIGPTDSAMDLGRDACDLASNLKDVRQHMTGQNRRFLRNRIKGMPGIPEYRGHPGRYCPVVDCSRALPEKSGSHGGRRRIARDT